MFPAIPRPDQIMKMVDKSVAASVDLTRAIIELAAATNRHAAALEEQNRQILAPASSIELFASATGGQ